MKKLFPYALLTTVVAAVYANTMQNSFHFDDIPSILEKPWIRGLDKIPQFILSYWQRPLVILSLNLNYAVSEFEVWSYHLFNIACHLVAACLVYRLGRAILDAQGQGESAVPSGMPLMAAVVFALHPLNTQTVTYISSRSAAMATCFYLAAVLAFVRCYREFSQSEGKSPPWGIVWMGLAVLAFILGFLSKQIVVSLPAALFLFHFYFLSEATLARWFRAQARWIVLAGAVLAAGVLIQVMVGGGLVRAQKAELTPLPYALTQTSVVPLEYGRKMLFPFNLSLDIPFPVLDGGSIPALLPGMLLLAAVLGLWIGLSRSKRPIARLCAFSLGWIGVTLLPTSSVVPLLDVAVEHRTYLPMVGFALLTGTLWSTAENHLQRGAWAHAGGMALLVLFAAGTMDRNRAWKDEITLWSDVKQKAPHLIRAYNNLGEAYDRLGEYDKAIVEFEAALEIEPSYVFALNNLGNVHGKKKEYDKAIQYFQMVLRLDPGYAPAYFNLGRALHLVGQREAAAQAYRMALVRNPYFEECYFNLGFLALELGQADEAMQNLAAYIKLRPGDPRARFGMGNALAMKGKPDQALAAYQAALEADPDFTSAYVNIGNVQMQMGRVDDAVEAFEKFLNQRPPAGKFVPGKGYMQDPQAAGVHKNLALIFYQFKPDPEKAVFHFEEFLRLFPTSPEVEPIRNLVADLRKQIAERAGKFPLNLSHGGIEP